VVSKFLHRFRWVCHNKFTRCLQGSCKDFARFCKACARLLLGFHKVCARLLKGCCEVCTIFFTRYLQSRASQNMHMLSSRNTGRPQTISATCPPSPRERRKETRSCALRQGVLAYIASRPGLKSQCARAICGIANVFATSPGGGRRRKWLGATSISRRQHLVILLDSLLRSRFLYYPADFFTTQAISSLRG